MKIILKLFLTYLTILSFSYANEKVTLQLSWLHQFQFAGYYMAKEKGFYTEAGLDVDIKEFRYGINNVHEIENNKVDFAVGRSSLLIDKFKGKDIVALAAIFQDSPLMLLVKKDSNINSIEDLRNKRIMLTSDAKGSASIIAMLSSKGVYLSDVKIQKHSFNLDDLITEKTDAMGSYISNEPIRLDSKKISYKIFHPKDYGFKFYDDILFSSSKFIKDNPELTKRFYEASIKGWEYAFSNIAETSEVIYESYNTQKKSKFQLYREGEILKNLAYDNKHGLIGYLDDESLEKIVDVYKIMGYIDDEINMDEFIYEGNNNKVFKLDLTTIEMIYLVVISILSIFIIVILVLYTSLQNKWFLTQKDLKEEIQLVREDIESKKELIEYQFKKLNLIINSSNAFIIIKDENLKYVLCNNAFLRFLGKDENEVIGKKNDVIFSESIATKLDDIDTNVIKNNKEVNRNDWITSSGDNQRILINSYIKPFEYEKGKKGVLIYSVDITKQKKLENEKLKNQKLMLRNNKMIALSKLLTNIAHQWRQPLSVVSLSLSSIKLNYELGIDIKKEELLDSTTNALGQIEHLSKTLDTFNDFFYSDKSDFSIINIKDLFEELDSLVDDKLSQNSIKKYLEVDSVTTSTNTYLMIQSLVSIIQNSIDAFIENKIEEKNRYIFITAKKEKEKIVIKIKDSAGGIKKDMINRIFEPYSTSKHQGIGVGLSLYITYHIVVEQFDGEIISENIDYSFDNNDLKGVEITITVPIK